MKQASCSEVHGKDRVYSGTVAPVTASYISGSAHRFLTIDTIYTIQALQILLRGLRTSRLCILLSPDRSLRTLWPNAQSLMRQTVDVSCVL